MRINKYLARCGLGSRRKCDEFINKGQIKINGFVIKDFSYHVKDDDYVQFKNKILNIHPALLPDFGGRGFYGMKVHEAVLKSGAEYSGATVHFVDEKYDHGPIIAQRKVKILDTDTVEALAERVLKVEHELYPEVVKASCENRIIMENNKPRILEYNEN